MNWDRERPRSAWRDFAFVWNDVRSAVEPPVPLAATLGRLQAISSELADSPRKRQPQLSNYFGQDSPIS